jgi:peptidoglycan/LPS O-acetylase OafA/YrhL
LAYHQAEIAQGNFRKVDVSVKAAAISRETSSQSHARIPSLDGIRAVSVMLVFVAHAGLDAVVPGGLGVTAFFFLSGFLITTLLRGEYDRNGFVSFRHFWLRRALRILPPFYFVLLGAIGLTLALFHPTFSRGAMTAQALQYTNFWIVFRGYDGLPIGTSVYWSLAVEEHFYLLFPLLYVAMRKMGMDGKMQAIALWSLCAVVLVWRMILVLHYHQPMERTYFATDTRLDSILFGCALAVWNNPVIDPASSTESRSQRILLPLAVAALLASLLLRNPDVRETVRYSVQGLALSPIFVAAIRRPQWGIFRLLNTRPMIFIGVISYSLYLSHFAIIISLQKILPALHPVLQGVAAFVVSIAAAWCIYAFIERPCARLRKKLTDW